MAITSEGDLQVIIIGSADPRFIHGPQCTHVYLYTVVLAQNNPYICIQVENKCLKQGGLWCNPLETIEYCTCKVQYKIQSITLQENSSLVVHPFRRQLYNQLHTSGHELYITVRMIELVGLQPQQLLITIGLTMLMLYQNSGMFSKPGIQPY